MAAAMESLRSRSVTFLPLFLVLALALAATVSGSIHTYDRESFRENGNAYLLPGGSEGIVAAGESRVVNGRSYIK